MLSKGYTADEVTGAFTFIIPATLLIGLLLVARQVLFPAEAATAAAHRTTQPPAHRQTPPESGQQAVDRLPEDANELMGYYLRTGTFWTIETVAMVQDLIPFLDENREPGTWYAALQGVNWGDPAWWDVVRFMVNDPDCPAIVAAQVLMIFRVQDLFDPARSGDAPDDDACEIIALICQRDAGEGYREYDFADPDGVGRQETRLAVIDAVSRHPAPNTLPFPPPLRLLMPRTDGARLIRKFIADETGLGRVVTEA